MLQTRRGLGGVADVGRAARRPGAGRRPDIVPRAAQHISDKAQSAIAARQAVGDTWANYIDLVFTEFNLEQDYDVPRVVPERLRRR